MAFWMAAVVIVLPSGIAPKSEMLAVRAGAGDSGAGGGGGEDREGGEETSDDAHMKLHRLGLGLREGFDFDWAGETGGERLGVLLQALGLEAVARWEHGIDGFLVVIGKSGFGEIVDGGVADFDADIVFAGFECSGEIDFKGGAPGCADAAVVDENDGGVFHRAG